MDQYIALAVSFGVPLLIAVMVYAILSFLKNRRRQFLKTLRLRLLSVRLAQKMDEREKKDFLQEINFSSQLFGLLSGLKIPFSLETAVHNVGEDIHFYVAVPEDSMEFATKQIQGLWPEAQVVKCDDYTIFNSQGAVKAAFLKLKQHYATPVRTFAEANIDTFLPLLSNFSKVELAGEGMAIQILVRPAHESARKSISDYI